MILVGLRCMCFIGIKFRFFFVFKFDLYEILFVLKYVCVVVGKFKVVDLI